MVVKIAFLTLLLGLTLSEQRIAVAVTEGVQQVELLLDGRVVSVMKRPPWSATIDFGTRLVPHRLLARAVDANGNELARAEQVVNLPRAAAEAEILLEREEALAPKRARLVWQSLEGRKPKQVELSLDGARIAVGSDLRAELPSLDIGRPHLLRARLVSELGVASDAELAFGGGLEGATATELTATMVRVRDPKRHVTTAEMEGSLTVRGSRPGVVAIDEVSGEVLVVRHPLEAQAAARLDPGGQSARRRLMVAGTTGNIEGMSAAIAPPGRTLVRYIWPVGSRTGKADLFPPSRTFAFATSEDFKRVLCDVGFPGSSPQLRFADAAAVAGLRAVSSKRPRAVVLIVGARQSDASRLIPDQVRQYLATLRVPFYVWSLTGENEAWSEARDISTPAGFRTAFDELRGDLDSQRIVWLRGAWLPQEIELTAAAAGLLK
jgi:hypothetical protein